MQGVTQGKEGHPQPKRGLRENHPDPGFWQGRKLLLAKLSGPWNFVVVALGRLNTYTEATAVVQGSDG